MPQPRITRDDVTSMVGARSELGDEMEPAVIAAWLGIAGVNYAYSRGRRDD